MGGFAGSNGTGSTSTLDGLVGYGGNNGDLDHANQIKAGDRSIGQYLVEMGRIPIMARVDEITQAAKKDLFHLVAMHNLKLANAMLPQIILIYKGLLSNPNGNIALSDGYSGNSQEDIYENIKVNIEELKRLHDEKGVNLYREIGSYQYAVDMLRNKRCHKPNDYIKDVKINKHVYSKLIALCEDAQNLHMAYLNFRIGSKPLKESLEDMLKQNLRKQHAGTIIRFLQCSRLAEEYCLKKMQAVNKLVEGNIRFVPYIAKRYFKHVIMPKEDLIAYGNSGLLKAAMLYDFRYNVKFVTYAGYWIIQKINKALAKMDLVIIPHSIKNKMRSIRAAERRLMQENMRYPTKLEIADELLRNGERVNGAFTNSTRRLENGSYKDRSGAAFEILDYLPDETIAGPETKANQISLSERVNELIDGFPFKTRWILKLRLGLYDGVQYNLQETAKIFKLTRERVRQIQKKALKRLDLEGKLSIVFGTENGHAL